MLELREVATERPDVRNLRAWVIIVSKGNNTGILAIVVIFAMALFVWQPWNASSGPKSTTTIINQQPTGAGAAGGSSRTTTTTK